jgi:S-phase kinase-associated protein 1
MLEDVGESNDQPIPLPNVTGPILQKVIDWCTHHRNDPATLAGDSSTAEDNRQPRNAEDIDECMFTNGLCLYVVTFK